MPKFPIALSIVALCLLIAIGQNWSPSLSIVFLGTTSVALPLGIWVGLAIATGAMTAIAIGWLFQLAGSSQADFSRPTIGASSPPPAPERAQRTWDDRTVAEPMRDREQPSVRDEAGTERVREAQDVEEWDNEEEWVMDNLGEVKTDDAYTPEYEVKAPSFEVQQEPIPTDREGSMYSYTYRDRKTETGRTDDIYASADDERNDAPKTAPVPPEQEPLEPEIVDPFPEAFPEAFEDDIRPSDDDLPPQSEKATKSSPSQDDDWTRSSKQNNEDW